VQKGVSFTEPKLYDYKGDLSKKWFVYFEVNNGEKQIRKQIRSIINYGRTVDERRKLARKVIAVWKEKLKKNYDPFIPLQTEAEQLSSMTFRQALEFALKECKPAVASKTYLGYALTVKYFITVADEINNSSIDSIKKLHIKLLLKRAQEKYKWSNKRYNIIYSYLRGIMSRLVDWEVIDYNPASKIKPLPVTETQKFVPYTQDEQDTIREYLYMHHYRFYIILSLIYHTGMRPKENIKPAGKGPD
jgi:integrase